ncbi:MAG TPA: thioesterase family protein [Acidimicrobiales bacterium]
MTSPEEGRALRIAASVEPLGPSHYSVNLSQLYTVMGHPHGGYLQCVMGSGALAAASDEGAAHLHVTAISTNYVNAPSVGPAELRTDVRRVGRGASFVHVALYQNELMVAESLATLGILHEGVALRYQNADVPVVAPIAECRKSTGSEEMNIMRVVDQRLDPATAGWSTGELSSNADVRGWLRLDDGEASWNAWSLLFASDALPPATFPLGSSGWVPTLQLTTYVRRIPTSEWLRARQWAVVIAEGLVDERLELFDETGELVASSSQLAMVRFPEGL